MSTTAHLAGLRCFSKATRRLGTVDRAHVTQFGNTILTVIFDDGGTHQGHATEFQAVRREPLTAGDRDWLRKLCIVAWNPAGLLVP